MNNKKQNHNLLSNIIDRLNRYEKGILNHKKSKNPSSLAIVQYEEMRNEMVTFLLDYLVENGNKDLLKQYVQNLDVPVAA